MTLPAHWPDSTGRSVAPRLADELNRTSASLACGFRSRVIARSENLARPRFDSALHPSDHIDERVKLVVDFSNDLLMARDEFGVLFDAGGGFRLEMCHHDKRI